MPFTRFEDAMFITEPLTFQFQDHQANPAPGILFYLVIATRKNPLHVGPFKVDAQGRRIVSGAEIEDDIQRAFSFGVMDYGYPSGPTELEIPGRDELTRRETGSRRFNPEHADRIANLATTCRNPETASSRHPIDIAATEIQAITLSA